MATETELKLTAPPYALRKAIRLPWLRKLADGPADRKKLVSVYFDTGNFKLRENGLTLRIRRDGRARVQTIKADAANGGFARNEWEHDVGADKPDLKLARKTALAPLATRKLEKSLKPVFETDVRRTVVPLRVGRSRLELAFDQGRIRTGKRVAPIAEIELELKQGARADLVRLSQRLAGQVPVSYGAQSKAERGYALRAGERNKAVRAAAIGLDKAQSTAEAFAAIGFACLHHAAANADAIRHGEAEGVHQMRVGLRRLRAAISVFRQVLRHAETERIKTELKWLTAQLAPARDLDVLVRESVAPLRRAKPGYPEIATLETVLARRRDAAFEKAKAAIESDRYRVIMLRTAHWLIDGAWRNRRHPAMVARCERPISRFARDVLERRARKIVKQAARLADMDARHRHKLRIRGKKLRYATDFFASLFQRRKAAKARKDLNKVLKELQGALGKLNDIAVHEKTAKQFAHPRRGSKKRPESAFAIGFLTGQEAHQARACLAAAAQAADQLSKTKFFWR